MMTEEDSKKPIIIRRVLHLSLALILTYYLFPDNIFGYPSIWLLAILFIGIPVVIEAIRLNTDINIIGLREHEKNHVASYAWFTTGAVLLIAFLPQQIAAPCILGAAIGDPVLGITRNLRRRYIISITFIIIFLIFFLFQYQIILALIAAGIVLISESVEFRIKWQLRPHLFYSRSKKKVSPYKKFFEILFKTDDDFMMQVIPAVSLAIIFLAIGWSNLPPELIHVNQDLAELLT